MPRRRPAKPASPADILRRRRDAAAPPTDPAQWGVDPAALRLPAHAEVEARFAGRERVVRAQRLDVFDRLASRGALNPVALGAVRRLQADVARLHGAAGGDRSFAPRVDASLGPGGFAEHRVEAGARVAAALERAGPASARLLGALIEPADALGRSVDWRAIVERETGETLPDAQAGVLRAACENLAGAYARLDRETRPRG